MGVALASWDGDVPHELGGLWRHVSDGPPETNYPTTSSVLVLGAGASAPDVRAHVLAALDRFGGSVLHVQADDATGLLSFPGATRVRRADIERYVHQARATIPLQRASLSLWLDSVEHSQASDDDLRVLRLLPRLHYLDTEWWRRTAALSRTGLEKVTQRVLRLNPGAALKCYRLASAHWLKSHHHSLSAIAGATGYSSKQTLSRAILTPPCHPRCRSYVSAA